MYGTEPEGKMTVRKLFAFVGIAAFAVLGMFAIVAIS
jgi:hypothetical protein